MANNKGKGGKKFKNRKRGKNNEGEDQKRELIIKEEGQEIYQDDKADVILINTPDEAKRLKNIGELPDGTRLNEGLLLILMMTPMLDEDIDKI
ncbi:hypothetical protein CUMW_124400 [Citrus unshiu]|nr:hypothetical protein CUMW_124400 [Citrus unshiu]